MDMAPALMMSPNAYLGIKARSVQIGHRLRNNS
jgi:hypothetical protein